MSNSSLQRLWFTCVFAAATALVAAEQSATPGRNAEAAARLNPVRATAESLAAGKQVYREHCLGCHGETGKGGVSIGYSVPTPDLTDDKWNVGSTDGEIFEAIKSGVAPRYDMAPWEERLDDEAIWNTVNYIRSLAPDRKEGPK